MLLLLAIAAVAAVGLAIQRPDRWSLDGAHIRATAASLRDDLAETATRVAARAGELRRSAVRVAERARSERLPTAEATAEPVPEELEIALGPGPAGGGGPHLAAAADTPTTRPSTRADSSANADSAAAFDSTAVTDSTLAAAADSMAVTSTSSAADTTPAADARAHPASGEVEKAGSTQAGSAGSSASTRIEISLEKRRLWLLRGRDTVLVADIAIGKGTTFEYEDKIYRFETPKGHLRILSKIEDPTWIPPDWHYYEKAIDQGLEPIFLRPGDRFELSDGSYMEMRGDTVGRVNLRGQWWEWTPGMEIILDGRIFVPPLTSPQRRIPDALGPYKLGLGNGVFIHGTNPYDEDSIGQAVSHGCIRVTNEQLHEIYSLVKVGTRVYIH